MNQGLEPEALQFLQQALSASAAVHAAVELGVFQRLDAGPAGCQDRYAFLEGDMFAVELERTAFDLVVLGNICHLFPEARNGEFVARLASALRPGGRLAIIDHLWPQPPQGGRRDDTRATALYAIGLLLRTKAGRVYETSAFAAWLERAGLGEMRCDRLSASIPIWLMVATR